MTPWLLAAGVLFLALLPCFVVAMRGAAVDRLVGFEALSVIASVLFVVLSRAFGQTYLYDLAIATALLSFGGGLVFARFVERWL